jgi:CHAT domain-containing protein
MGINNNNNDMATTHGHPDLPFVEDEIGGLKNLFEPHLRAKVNTHPTRAKIQSNLSDFHIVHLSCHGISSAIDPSQSMLLLEDCETTPLTVADLLSMNIRQSQFAYLSACQTATGGDVKLLAESIHLSSAIQLGGFPSVVGTLWRVGDRYSAKVAQEVYEGMLDSDKQLGICGQRRLCIGR